MDKQVWVDKTGEIKSYFEKVLSSKADVAFLGDYDLNFLFTFTSKELFDDEGMLIAATARKIGTRERDVYNFDFELCCNEEYWETLPESARFRLIHHEMMHMRIQWVYDDEIEMELIGTPDFDKQGRMKVFIEPHDLVIKTFKEEIRQYGLSGHDLAVAEFLNSQMIKKALVIVDEKKKQSTDKKKATKIKIKKR